MLAKKGDGMTSCMRTLPRASSISYLTKPTVNPIRAIFVIGHRESEIRRYQAVLGALSGIAIRREARIASAFGSEITIAPSAG
jgi:hypothetical protein